LNSFVSRNMLERAPILMYLTIIYRPPETLIDRGIYSRIPDLTHRSVKFGHGHAVNVSIYSLIPYR